MNQANSATHSQTLKIALSGGPGGGKTTAADLFQRELSDQLVMVPESATIVFTGGFPRTGETIVKKATQRAIFHVQKNLEESIQAHHPNKTLLCDRGTVDGAAYWPGDCEEFFWGVGTTFEAELARYDAILFFETAAKGGQLIESNNPYRNETMEQAIALDEKLRSIWSKHPNFHLVPHHTSFFQKITMGVNYLTQVFEGLKLKKNGG